MLSGGGVAAIAHVAGQGGMRYRPLLSRAPMRIGFPLQVISTSSSLCTVTLSLVKLEMVPASEVFPTLIRECGKSSNVSAYLVLRADRKSVRLDRY